MENNVIKNLASDTEVKLSIRENEVLKHLLMAKNNKEVASTLFISERTVKYHCSNIYSKYSVVSRAELILKCVKNCTDGQALNLKGADIISQPERWPIEEKNSDICTNRLKGVSMRELTISELEIVSGGVFDGDVIAAVSAIAAGGGVGLAQWAGLTATQQATVGGLFGIYGAALTTAAYGGLTAGNWLNKNTPIQTWIANALDALNGNDGDGE